nr:uncharacterized protein LOC108008191 [Drosophila suzukii]
MSNRVEIFYKGQKALLNVFSLWPQNERHWRIFHQVNHVHVMGFWVLLFDLLLVMHVVGNLSSMSEVVRAIFVLATSAGHTTKLLSIKANNVELEELFKRLDEDDFRPRGVEEELILAAACERSRKLRDFYGALSVAALSMILIPQFVVDWSQLPLGTYNPFADHPGSPGYWLLYCYQCLALTVSCVTNIGFDSLSSSLFIFIKCQLDLLAVRLDKMGRWNSAGGSVEQQLKQNIRYHMAIVELTATVERLLCKPISMQIFCSVLVLTANFYAIALLSDEKLALFKYITYQACMLSQIFILCYYAGEVTQRSLDLPHELYKTSWVNWNKDSRRIVLLFMQRLHSTLRIRTLNPSLGFDLMLFSSSLGFVAYKRLSSRGLAGKVKIVSMSQHQMVTDDFYKYQVWYFQVLGIWQLPISATDHQRRFQSMRFILILIILCIMLLLFALELLSNISQVREILKVFFMFATEISCMTKLLHLRLESRKLDGLVEMMMSEDFTVKSEEERLILESARKAVVHMRNFYGITSWGAALLILLIPCYANYEELPLAMLEVCSIQGRLCYGLQYLFHTISLLPTCVLNITYDSVAFSLLCFLKVQLQVLVLRLEKLGPANCYPDNERIGRELRECAAYYNKIVQFKNLVELFIKVPGSVQLMCSVLVLVSNLYDMSTMSVANGDAIFMARTCIYQLVMLWQIFIICYASNDVTVQSSRLCHGIYSAQWTGWNRSNRRILLLMMQRFNSPMVLRTFNPTFVFSLEAFGSIVNCSYSYFALLKRVNS